MSQVEHYHKHVSSVPADAPLSDVADRMFEDGVGCVVVTADDEQPIGLITDRDLTVRVVAEGRDPSELIASAVMSQPLVSADPSDGLEDVIGVMREHGVRRIPVVRDKRAIGIVTVDDLLVALSTELEDLAQASRREVTGARRAGQVQEIRREVEEGVYELIGRVERLGDRTVGSALEELDDLVRRVRRLFD